MKNLKSGLVSLASNDLSGGAVDMNKYHEVIQGAQAAVKKFPIPHQIYIYQSDGIPRILPIDFYDENEVNEIPLCVVFTEFSDYPRNTQRLSSGGGKPGAKAFKQMFIILIAAGRVFWLFQPSQIDEP